MPGKIQPADVYGGYVRASIRCAARTAQPDTALWQVWQTSQHCLSPGKSVFFPSLTTQMKEKPEETVIFPPHTALALHRRDIAELYKVSVFFFL